MQQGTDIAKGSEFNSKEYELVIAIPEHGMLHFYF